MSMDGLSLYRMLSELQCLVGSKVDKVQQPDRDSVLIFCHGADCGRSRLYLNIHNELGRVQMTGESHENPVTAPAFCMLLRKRLIGCRITDIRQEGTDRIVSVSFSGRDELKDEQTYSLLLELMGRHGNLFLLDGNGSVLDCLRHIGIGEGVLRPALPGLKYSLPPEQEKDDPFTAGIDAFAKLSSCKQMMTRFARLSRQTAELLYSEAEGDPVKLQSAFFSIAEGRTAPCVLPGAGPLPFTPVSAVNATPYKTMSDAFDAYYRERDARLASDRLTGSLRTTIEHALRRCRNKLENFTADINGTEQAETWRLYGELLTSYYGTAPRGAEYVTADNWYLDPPAPVRIPLQKDLDLAGNAARYFKKYRKAKTAREFALNETVKLQEEISYLENQQLSLSLVSSSVEAGEIRDELIRLRYIRPAANEKKQPKVQTKSRPLTFISPDGIRIRVGKNNLQNDSLTKNAPAGALWLHAKDMPGSHVIAECGGPCPEQTLKTAALLAAYFSKGRGSSQVPVDYLPAARVKKPAGSRPGFVTFTGQRTFFVTPKDELLPKEVY